MENGNRRPKHLFILDEGGRSVGSGNNICVHMRVKMRVLLCFCLCYLMWSINKRTCVSSAPLNKHVAIKMDN